MQISFTSHKHGILSPELFKKNADFFYYYRWFFERIRLSRARGLFEHWTVQWEVLRKARLNR